MTVYITICYTSKGSVYIKCGKCLDANIGEAKQQRRQRLNGRSHTINSKNIYMCQYENTSLVQTTLVQIWRFTSKGNIMKDNTRKMIEQKVIQEKSCGQLRDLGFDSLLVNSLHSLIDCWFKHIFHSKETDWVRYTMRQCFWFIVCFIVCLLHPSFTLLDTIQYCIHFKCVYMLVYNYSSSHLKMLWASQRSVFYLHTVSFK